VSMKRETLMAGRPYVERPVHKDELAPEKPLPAVRAGWRNRNCAMLTKPC
jgi:hypothetical protein